MKKTKKTIGRKDKIDFPELDLFEIDAKVDTGAYTSAIHCHNIEPFEKDGEKWVRFNLLDPRHPDYNERLYEHPVSDIRKIKNSFGQIQKRFIIKTVMRIHGKRYRIELSLADRSKLEFPVLLGRKAINKRFIVDVSRTDVSFESQK